MRTFKINGMEVTQDGPCYVIAEIGHNHQGSLERAKEMFQLAKQCGANAAKLQKRNNKTLYTKQMYDSPYVSENSMGKTYGEHREKLEFGEHEYIELKSLAQDLDIGFFSTAFDFESADFLEEMGISAYKIASADLLNTPLLKYIAKLKKPMVLSTGGATLEDVRRAHDTIQAFHSNFCILQCTASYPCEPKDMNLRVIETYMKEFPETIIGLSDHQNGISLATAAYTLGARVVEKHFTFDRAAKGTDHAFSLEPVGLRKLVRDLSRVHAAMGDGEKRPLSCEEKPLYKMGKKLVAARDLSAGSKVQVSDVVIKSPGGGLHPFYLDQVVGKILKKPIKEEEDFSLDLLES